ncbi:MAG: tandem-95 repeat protein [Rubrivivax sp.]|nr:tandem-95 repeat protein [Rubrivivax sp.]
MPLQALAQANSAPVALNDVYTVAQGGTLSVAAPGVLANDTDANGDNLFAWRVSSPATGTISFASNGGFTYRPPAGFTGTVTFGYRAYDTRFAFSPRATVTINVVGAANQAPQITSAPVTTATVGASYSYDVNAADPNGDALAYSLTQAPAGMTINAASGLIAWTPTAAQAGSQAVTVRAADPGGLAATQSFTVNVGAANAAPQITTSAVTAARVGVSYAYDVNATDPNGDTLTYSLSQAPSGMTINAASGVIAWTPTAAGSQGVTVRVADPGGLAATQAFTITVAAANAAPQITTTPVTSGTVGVAYAYDVNATDPNGDALTYSLTQAPSGMTINASSGLIAWTPGTAGSQAVTVRVADPAGLAATQSFTIAVAAGNAAPQITSVALTTGTVGVAYAYDVNAADPNGDTLTYSLTQAPSGMAINASTGMVTWVPTTAGSQGVTVRVADPGGLAATQSFTITVAAANAAPQITTTPVTAATVGAAYAYDVNATDPNGDVLAYSLTQAPSGMSIGAGTGLIAWTPSTAQVGSQPVTVRVADPGGLAVTQAFTITVVPASPVPTTTRVDAATPATYAAAAGSQLAITLNWYRLRMAANYLQFMHLVNAAGQTWSVDDHSTTSATWTPGPFSEVRTITVPAGLANGTYDIRVGLSGGNPWTDLTLAMGAGVTDPAGDHRYRVGTLTLGSVANQAPAITTSPPTAGVVGTAYAYDVNATDPNGDVLTYSLTQAPSGMSINASNGLIAWTPSSAQLGSQTVTVRVADPGGLAATQAFSINVAAAGNAAPQIGTTAVTTATVGVAYVYDVNATDPNGDALTYSLTQAPSGMTIQAASGLIAWTPTAAQVGTQAVTVRVVDPGGLAATQAFSVTVGTAPPPAPGPMTMSCADGSGWQCSGETVLRSDNGVALTRSGVQVYGRSTSDLGASNPNISNATGLQIVTGGTAEIRVRKDANAAPNSVAVLLSNLSILWNGAADRPQVIETFNPTAGRVFLNGSGALTFGALPPPSDLSYYDFATRGTGATRANYATNRYFPRADPPRCDPGWCATAETTGPQYGTGTWRGGGTDADMLAASRYHEDGDIHAGNGLPDANGNPTWLPGGNGFGVPVPGSKGYRTLNLWNYRYANVASWFTQDTVNIAEWGGVFEHNKNRRGFVAFGDTTDPALVPTSGGASYAGVVHGQYSANGSSDPVPFIGTATVSVNFATRSVTVSIQNTVRNDGSGAALPLAMTATTVLGTGGNANHLTGAAASGSLSGGLGARLFGPIATGGSGSGPAELGGAYSLSNGTAAVVAGFIARKQ